MKRNRESGMVSVETALSIGPLLAVIVMISMPLIGWIYVMEAEHQAREISREYALHGESAVNGLVSQVEARGDEVRINRFGPYANITVIKKVPAFMTWLGVELSGSRQVVMEPDD
ncbi:hypothetical protein [Arcanobacterium phocae]|uniref:hypothetical protein n=1 Tax=Arcanobacterium phocae TaxID=131112 RepID=UPI001C0EA215|nr:hypothetical protein [Arcanobacterium phocae]